MNERTFFKRPAGFTVGEIAKLIEAVPREDADLGRAIVGVGPLDLAGPNELTFFDDAKFHDQFLKTRAGVCLMKKQTESLLVGPVPAGIAVLFVDAPYRAFVTVSRALFPGSLRPSSIFETDGIAEGATVHRTARLEDGVAVDPGAVIGPRAEIGSGTVIAANAVIGPDVRIGRDCFVGTGTTISHTMIGDRVIIHSGCHIGQDGFGYLLGARNHVKVPQIARVIIQDDVEIGASTTIDRGGLRDTMIGEGTKIDNLVQIGHNVSIGRHCIVVAQSGLSGSVTLEDFVVLGARVGIVEHIHVGEGAQLAARSTVLRDVPAGARWGGLANAKPVRQWMRELVAVERLSRGADAGRREK